MKQLSSVVERDPLKLKSLDSTNKVTSKTMYIFLVLIPVFLILGMGFHWLSSTLTSDSETSTDEEGKRVPPPFNPSNEEEEFQA